MLNIIKNWSIKSKLIAILLIVSIFTLVFGGSLSVYIEITSKREEFARLSVTQAKLLAEYSVSPMVFEDKDGATEVLSKAMSLDNLSCVVLLNMNGNVFTSFNLKSPENIIKNLKFDYQFIGKTLHVKQPVIYNDKLYGYIYLVADTTSIDEQLVDYIKKTILFTFLILLIALFITYQLQKIVSVPIYQLAEITKEISVKKDYQMRVEKKGNDEIGVLYDNFNLLMDTIQIQQKIQNEAESDLTEMTKQLMKHNNELQRFAYITSHDLRAPVVNLVNLLNFIEKDDLNEKNKLILDKIDISIQQLNNTLHELIEIVSLKKNLDDAKEIINFETLLHEITTGIEKQIEESKAEIKADFKIKEIFYIKSHINSILLNLLTNAIKYRSSERKPTIFISTELVNNYVCLKVADNGLGIDLNKNKRNVFGLHKRFHYNIEGKGIGLFILKSLVESLDGEVDVESEVGQGSNFIIYLKCEIK